MTLQSILRHSSVYLIGDLVRRSVGLLLLPFYTHYLSPSDYGTIELLDLAIMVTSLVFGISAAGDAMVRVYHEQPDDKSRGNVVSTMIWLICFLGSAVTIVGVLFAGPLSRWLFKSDLTALVRLAFFTMSFSALTELLMLYQQIRGRHLVWVACSVAQTLALISLNIYFIAGRRMGIWGFLTSKCIVVVIAVVVLLIATIRETSWAFRWPLAKHLIAFGSPLIISSSSAFIVHFSDRFFLSRYSTLADLGVYALAYKMGMLVSVFVGGPFGAVWNATFYSHLAKTSWRSDFARTLLYLSATAAFVAVGISAFSRPVIGMAATAGYWGAIALVPVIAVAYGLRSIGDFFRGMLFITKKSRLFGILCAICAALNLVLNTLLIPSFGIFGAAWATLITWAAYLAACCWFAQRENPLPVHPRHYAALAGLTAVAIAAAVLGAGNSSVQQIGLGLVVVIAFIGGLILFDLISREDRERFANLLLTGRARIAAAVRSW